MRFRKQPMRTARAEQLPTFGLSKTGTFAQGFRRLVAGGRRELRFQGGPVVLKPCLAVALMIPAFLSPCLGADKRADWEAEAEQVALEILRLSRERVGKLSRFDVEYLLSRVDAQFGTEERSRVHTYCEDPLGYIVELRAIDDAYMKCGRRSKSGEPYKLKRGRLETWMYRRGLLEPVSKAICQWNDPARNLRSEAGERRHSHVVDAFLLAQSGPQLEGVQDGTQTATHR